MFRSRRSHPETRDPAAEEPGSGARMPAQEEGVHQVPREPCGGAGEPEQGAHRRAEGAQRAVLPAEDGLNRRRRSGRPSSRRTYR